MEISSLFDPAHSALVVILGVVCLFLSIETVRFQRHRRALAKIPFRIHINGSRGKSSVTRLIGAILRQTEKITVTKTTGTAPRFIMPDGREIPVFRAGKPNIIEQLKIVNKAASLGTQILVTECMAVTPEYISTLEEKIICSTVGVITNIREDHLDVMGPTVYDVTVNMARSLPKNSIAFTAEKKWFKVLEKEAQLKGSQLVLVSEENVTDAEMQGFGYVEHKENVALALAVTESYGLSRQQAFAAMYSAQPDPGVLRKSTLHRENGTLHFFNALAANDPDSTILIWNMAKARHQGKTVALLILRSDRIQRTESFAQVLGVTLEADLYIVAGTSVAFVINSLKKKGIAENKIIALHTPKPEAVVEALMQSIDHETVAVAMGNIIGLGELVIQAIEENLKNKLEIKI